MGLLPPKAIDLTNMDIDNGLDYKYASPDPWLMEFASQNKLDESQTLEFYNLYKQSNKRKIDTKIKSGKNTPQLAQVLDQNHIIIIIMII